MTLHTEELCNLYSSPSTVRIFRSKRLIWLDIMLEKGETRTQRKWEDNINMDIGEMGCEDGKLMEQAQKYFVIRSSDLQVTLPVSLITLDMHILKISCKEHLEA
jgi:hypothetical protein